jgi:hypothetical protein
MNEKKELENLVEKDDLKSVSIKILTKDNMVYTWCVINAETLPVKTDLDEGFSISKRIYHEIYTRLSELWEVINNKQPIIMYWENKIIDYSLFKETIINWEKRKDEYSSSRYENIHYNDTI